MRMLTIHQRQTLLWIATAGVLAWLTWLLTPILTPFVAGAVLAYILNPGVEWLIGRKFGKFSLPRWVAAILMILLLIFVVTGLMLILIPVLSKEAGLLQQQLPSLVDKLNAIVSPKLKEWFGLHVQLNGTTFKRLVSEQFSSNTDLAGTLLDYAKTGGIAVAGLLGTLLLLPVVLFYTLEAWPELVKRVQALVPRRYIKDTGSFIDEINVLLSQFLRGQLSVMLMLAVFYSTALALAGFEIALPVGILTGLLVFIPYVGYAMGLTLALIAALLQFGNLYGLIAVAVIYGLGQIVESFLLTPMLVGEKIGLHPLMVIFALMAFGQLFGFVGVLIALPVSAVLAVAIRHLHTAYLRSEFYRQ
jgi:predicted PurR-regulated permease PerM